MSLPRIFTDTSQCLFEPIECLEKRAALMPRPAVNVLPYHGVLLPRARWRSPGVRSGRAALPHPARPPSARGPPIDQTLDASLSPPLHPRLDREPAAVQGSWGPTGAHDADPRLCPVARAVPGPEPGSVRAVSRGSVARGG
jgi:hypothetical protein